MEGPDRESRPAGQAGLSEVKGTAWGHWLGEQRDTEERILSQRTSKKERRE